MTTLHDAVTPHPSAQDGTSDTPVAPRVAVVVPHTHWDREWYAPFETMRFHLVRFLDELIDTLEAEPDLPVFLLDGQSAILDDYLEIRIGQRSRVQALVAAGRLRPGPFYVQPDELLVSGESIVRNLLLGCQTAKRYGRVMREGYLPDTFGHVHQLPQILRGFDIETFYAMRGFADDPESVGSEFHWQAPDGSTVMVSWLTESYSNAGVLSADADVMPLHHGALVRYDSLHELVQRMAHRTRTGVLLLLNGGDHLRVQQDVPSMVKGLRSGTDLELRMGGLEEYHELMLGHFPQRTISGELRHGRRHDVFDGIGSTRTPLKAVNERAEALLGGVAERVAAVAEQMGGPRSGDSLRYAWRELIKNHAHDSICGCSVDEVHEDMIHRYDSVTRVSEAVLDDALQFIAHRVATPQDGVVPVVVLNPSGHTRSALIGVDVVPDLAAPLGIRRFGWIQELGVDLAEYVLLDPEGAEIAFQVTHPGQVRVVDALDRRKEVIADRVHFLATDVPGLSTTVYRLLPRDQAAPPVRAAPGGSTIRTANGLRNALLEVAVAPTGQLRMHDLRTGRTFTGLLEFLDDGDAGDEYSFGPLPEEFAVSSLTADWTVRAGTAGDTLSATATMSVPRELAADRRTRSTATALLALELTVRLAPSSDRVDVEVTVDNTALDHRIRLRFPTGTGQGRSHSESAYGLMERDAAPSPEPEQWREAPSGVYAMRRFVTVQDQQAGLQILTEGLHEHSCSADGTVDVTLLRSVGWLARTDHPLRTHKIGPMVPTPAAQCLGTHTFRIGLRPFSPIAPTGELYRAAEEFSVPLVARSVQGVRVGPQRRGEGSDGGGHGEPAAMSVPLGLAIEPADAVLSAVKTAEDDTGVIVRVFNAGSEPITARLSFAVDSLQAWQCNLEEQPTGLRLAVDNRSLTMDLAVGAISTVLLRSAARSGSTS